MYDFALFMAQLNLHCANHWETSQKIKIAIRFFFVLSILYNKFSLRACVEYNKSIAYTKKTLNICAVS